jgi:hypothetical protein
MGQPEQCTLHVTVGSDLDIGTERHLVVRSRPTQLLMDGEHVSAENTDGCKIVLPPVGDSMAWSLKTTLLCPLLSCQLMSVHVEVLFYTNFCL